MKRCGFFSFDSAASPVVGYVLVVSLQPAHPFDSRFLTQFCMAKSTPSRELFACVVLAVCLSLGIVAANIIGPLLERPVQSQTVSDNLNTVLHSEP